MVIGNRVTMNGNRCHRLSALLAVLGCCAALPGCGDEQACAPDDTDCVDFDAIARERGFETAPADFFEFLQLACVVDTAEPPSSVEELFAETDSVFLGRISEVVPLRDPNATIEDYDVELDVMIDETLKGDLTGTVTLGTSCAHAGKVAGLRHSKPDDELLFFVNPSSRAEDDRRYLAYFYLGVVRDTEVGPDFALFTDWAPALDAYTSLDQLAAALR